MQMLVLKGRNYTRDVLDYVQGIGWKLKWVR